MEKKPTVLYAEDEPELLEIIQEILISEGYNCLRAKDGLEATEIIAKENIDLLLTDFNMPRMSGSELLFWARSHGYHFPVIFITGAPERIPIEKKALKDCCASLLNKPVSTETLLEAIESARKRRHEFDCHGKVGGTEKGFEGIHYLDGKKSE